MTDAEIAGYMGWRGPGVYTQHQMRRVKALIAEVVMREREACAPAGRNQQAQHEGRNMSLLSAAASDEDGYTIRALRAKNEHLRAENEQLRQSLLALHETLEMTAKAGASYARDNEGLRDALILWSSRAEQAKDLLEAIGAGGVGKVEQPPVVEQVPIAYEFYNPATGHAIVDYSEHTHVGHLSADKGYVAKPLYTHPQPPVVEQKPVYAFRRRGQDSFCTCDFRRYKELSSKPDLFEVALFYTHPQPRQPLTDEQIEAALKVWFETEKPFEERMRAAFAAAHNIGGEA